MHMMSYCIYGVNPVKIDSKTNIFELFLINKAIVWMTYIPSEFGLTETRLISIYESQYDRYELRRRYKIMPEIENNIEIIQSEIEDDYSDDSLFNISSWGADLSFRELISMYEDNELVKPELQRKYVWDRTEASRFIESILLGLPVPSIFLAQAGSQKLIVDGYQRIMTVYDYVKRGLFSSDKKVFRLSNSEKINVRWRNKAFSELSTDDQRKIRSTTIHAIIFEQKKPEDDDTSLYQIFERINTSGRSLTAQEIRNCVYQGSFNNFLFALNENRAWRSLFGVEQPDNRMRDIEYILRFFTLKSDFVLKNESTKISLKKALNDYMQRHRNDTVEALENERHDFETITEQILALFGPNAFRNYSNGKYSRKFHPAIFDAVMISALFCQKTRGQLTLASENCHITLLENSDFKTAISERTTDIENIKKRIGLASSILFGVSIDEA